MPLTQGPWPFAPILLPSTIPRLSSSIINPPSTGVAIGGVAIGGAPSAVALGAEPPPEKRRHGERGPDGRPRAARRCKECKKQGRTDQQQPTWCSGRLANKGETPFFFCARAGDGPRVATRNTHIGAVARRRVLMLVAQRNDAAHTARVFLMGRRSRLVSGMPGRQSAGFMCVFVVLFVYSIKN